MALLKDLRHIYRCDSLNELAKLLGIAPRTIYDWNCGGIPADKQGLLRVILEQKREIDKLREKEN